MACREMEQYLSPYFDGELAPEEYQMVQYHLTECAICRREYDELVMLVSVVKQMGNEFVPAPAGFKDAVMKQILEGNQPVSILEHASKLVGRWKPAITATAAALLITLAGLGIHLMPASHIANNTANHHPVVIADKGPSPSNKPVNNNSANNPAVSPSDSQATVNNTNSALAPLTENRVLNNGTNSSPVFLLNTEQVIKTTMLKIRTADTATALEQAVKMASGVGASSQNLGQQVNESGTCSVLKITVAKSASTGLINSLNNLGTVSGQEVDKKDITSQFAQDYSKYQSLVAEREAAQDADQQAQLNQQIKKLENQLNSLQASAEKETIVLWLEK
ncbi:MAG: zf-HC2 domain-containing protein [Syntrophomonas sp.]